MANTFLFCGLGNPGNKYQYTWHNVGFMTIELLAERYGIAVKKLKFKAVYGEKKLADGTKIILAKPQTYMNRSGESLVEFAAYFNISPENIIVIYDDIDLDVGDLRIRPAGGAGSHNGMKSILFHLQDDSFPRVRIGIGRQPDDWDLADYVLSKIPESAQKTMFDCMVRAAAACQSIVDEGLQNTMNVYNRKKTEECTK